MNLDVTLGKSEEALPCRGLEGLELGDRFAPPGDDDGAFALGDFLDELAAVSLEIACGDLFPGFGHIHLSMSNSVYTIAVELGKSPAWGARERSGGYFPSGVTSPARVICQIVFAWASATRRFPFASTAMPCGLFKGSPFTRAFTFPSA